MTAVKGLPPPPKRPVDITIERPFMFIIRDKSTKDVWFTGTVYEPSKYDSNEYKAPVGSSTPPTKSIPTKSLPSKK